MSTEVGSIVEGKVTGITKFGAFIDILGGERGLVHLSEVTDGYVENVGDYLAEGQVVKVKVLNISTDRKRIGLSIKQAVAAKPRETQNVVKTHKKAIFNNIWNGPKRSAQSTGFEDMMSKFKKRSEEKISDLKKVTESKRSGCRIKYN
jgi:S1 RNA binding domain protein